MIIWKVLEFYDKLWRKKRFVIWYLDQGEDVGLLLSHVSFRARIYFTTNSISRLLVYHNYFFLVKIIFVHNIFVLYQCILPFPSIIWCPTCWRWRRRSSWRSRTASTSQPCLTVSAALSCWPLLSSLGDPSTHTIWGPSQEAELWR